MGQLSKWLRGRVRTFGPGKQFSDVEAELKSFFASRPTVSVTSTKSIIVNTKPKVSSEESIKAFNVDVESTLSSANPTSSSIIIPSDERNVKKFDWFDATAEEKEGKKEKEDKKVIITSTASNASSVVKTKHSPAAQAHAQFYFKKVESSLSASSFSSFKTSLADFKKGLLGVEALLIKICGLFEGSYVGGEGVNLFEGFKTFVPEKHRSIHTRILNEFKQRSMNSEVIDLVEDENQPNFNMAMKRKLHPDFVGKMPIEYEPLYVSDNIASSGAVLPNLTSTSLNSSSSAQSSQNICPICRDPIVDGHRAKCGHEACYGCWTEWLSRTLECPLCRQRTRIPQLRK